MGELNRRNDTIRRSKVRVLSLVLAVVFVLSQAIFISEVDAASKVYMDKKAGSNSNSGESPEAAVKTLGRARKLVDADGVIYVKRGGEWKEVSAEEVDKMLDDKAKVSPTPTPEANGESKPTEGKKPVAKEEAKVTKEPTKEVSKTEVTEAPKAEVTEGPKAEVTEEPKVEVTDTPADEAEVIEMPETEVTNEMEPSKESVKEPSIAPEEEVETEVQEVQEPAQDTKEETPKSTGEAEVTEESEVTIDIAEVEEWVLTLEDKKDEEIVDELTKILEQITFMIETELDKNNVIGATKAYESLDAAAKANLSETSYKRLRAAQIVVGTANKMSNGLRVDGDLPWYVEFRAVANSAGNGTFDLGDLIGSYDMVLWNTLTDEAYKIDGSVTVTVPVDNPLKYTNLSVIHYFKDGNFEVLTPTIVPGENAISFTTTSFSPYQLVGSTTDTLDKNEKSARGSESSSGGTTKESEASKSSQGSSTNKSTNSSTGNSSNSSSGKSGGSVTRSGGARTGDDTNILMMGMGLASAVVIIGMVYVKKKKVSKDN